MCFEGEKWAMNSDHSEIEGEKKKENLPQTKICLWYRF